MKTVGIIAAIALALPNLVMAKVTLEIESETLNGSSITRYFNFESDSGLDGFSAAYTVENEMIDALLRKGSEDKSTYRVDLSSLTKTSEGGWAGPRIIKSIRLPLSEKVSLSYNERYVHLLLTKNSKYQVKIENEPTLLVYASSEEEVLAQLHGQRFNGAVYDESGINEAVFYMTQEALKNQIVSISKLGSE
ncbi:hypothetical protein [Vibrio sp. Hal054]|uniref:hypothetical protein n=1 Tax=Vibrio sp. Hal054 TaxID=3035158 RepID=UPI00301D109D